MIIIIHWLISINVLVTLIIQLFLLFIIIIYYLIQISKLEILINFLFILILFI